MTADEIAEKVHACCDPVLGATQTDVLVAELARLASARTLDALIAPLRPDPVAQDPAR
jgi:hypothetical protein